MKNKSGGKKEENKMEPAPKSVNNMNSEELKQMQKDFQKKITKEEREI